MSGEERSSVVLNLDAVPVLRDGAHIHRSSLRPGEASLVEVIDGRRSVADLMRLTGMSGYVMMRLLRSLYERNLIVPVMRGTQIMRPSSVRTPHVRSTATRPRQLPAIEYPSDRTSRTTAPRGRSFGAVVVDEDAAPDHQARSTPIDGGRTRATAPGPPPEAVEPPASTSRALVVATPRAIGAPIPKAIEVMGAPSSAAQELWFAATRRDWFTLVLVPATEGSSALPVGRALAKAGSFFRGKPVELMSALGLDLSASAAAEWIYRPDGEPPAPNGPGGRLAPTDQFYRVVVLDSVVANPAGLPIAQSADAVLLVVETEVTGQDAVKFTVEALRREHLMGCVLVPPNLAV